MKLDSILHGGWGITGQATALGSGRIHRTWSVTGVRQGRPGRWVLQRINPVVFPSPQAVLENAFRVSRHLNAMQAGWAPTLAPARTGLGWRAQNGSVWRLWDWLCGHARDKPESDAQAEAAGRAFGQTFRWLQQLPDPPPKPVIPGFADPARCLAAFDACAAKASPDLRAFIDKRRWLASEAPVTDSIIHGDCKFGNLLFDDAGQVVAVLDLDTAGPGHWTWDFGDLCRSILAGGVRVSRFAAVCRGYLATSGVIADAEALLLAPRRLAYCLGLRYLVDHLTGGRYFGTDAPDDKQQLARQRLQLVKQLEDAESALRPAAVEAVASSVGRLHGGDR